MPKFWPKYLKNLHIRKILFLRKQTLEVSSAAVLCATRCCEKRQNMLFGRKSVPAIVPRHPLAEYFDVPMVSSRLHGAYESAKRRWPRAYTWIHVRLLHTVSRAGHHRLEFHNKPVRMQRCASTIQCKAGLVFLFLTRFFTRAWDWQKFFLGAEWWETPGLNHPSLAVHSPFLDLILALVRFCCDCVWMIYKWSLRGCTKKPNWPACVRDYRLHVRRTDGIWELSSTPGCRYVRILSLSLTFCFCAIFVCAAVCIVTSSLSQLLHMYCVCLHVHSHTLQLRRRWVCGYGCNLRLCLHMWEWMPDSSEQILSSTCVYMTMSDFAILLCVCIQHTSIYWFSRVCISMKGVYMFACKRNCMRAYACVCACARLRVCVCV